MRLDLSGNQLEYGGYVVNVMFHDFREIPAEVGFLRNIRQIDLHHNNFKVIPACVFELPVLEILTADNNKIKTLGPELGRLRYLRVSLFKMPVFCVHIASFP